VNLVQNEVELTTNQEFILKISSSEVNEVSKIVFR
jgi:hypothetical protein